MGMKPSTRPVSIEQVRSLLKKSVRDMKDAATPGLSSERVFTILYEAGFSCAQAFALANKMEAPRDGGFGHHCLRRDRLPGLRFTLSVSVGAGQWCTTAAATLARSGRGSRSVLRGYGHQRVGGAGRYPLSLNSLFNAAFTHSKPKCSCSSRRFLRMRLSRSSSNNARSVSVSRGRSRTT